MRIQTLCIFCLLLCCCVVMVTSAALAACPAPIIGAPTCAGGASKGSDTSRMTNGVSFLSVNEITDNLTKNNALKLKPGLTNVLVDRHGICRFNDNTGGNSYFVPFKSAAEWVAYLDHLPGGAVATACCLDFAMPITDKCGNTVTSDALPIRKAGDQYNAQWVFNRSRTDTVFQETCTLSGSKSNPVSSCSCAATPVTVTWTETAQFTGNCTSTGSGSAASANWVGPNRVTITENEPGPSTNPGTVTLDNTTRPVANCETNPEFCKPVVNCQTNPEMCTPSCNPATESCGPVVDNYCEMFPEMCRPVVDICVTNPEMCRPIVSNPGSNTGNAQVISAYAFDPFDYIDLNPDLAADMRMKGIDPNDRSAVQAYAWNHYTQHGADENRPTSVDHNALAAQFPELAGMVGNGPGQFPSIAAYIAVHGTAQQQAAMQNTISASSTVFDPDYYLKNNPDVAAAVARGEFASALDHYNQYGRGENRQTASSELLQAGVTAVQGNSVSGGNMAGQTVHGVGVSNWGGFDATSYLQQYPDVAAAVASGQTTAQEHFLNYGLAEGRSGSTGTQAFDAAGYLAMNPDVAAAVAAGQMTAEQHYQTYGINEGRIWDSAQVPK